MNSPAACVPPFRLAVVATSAGGLAAMESVLAALPRSAPIAIAIVQHRTDAKPFLLARILGRHTKMLVQDADEGDRVAPGIVYVAQPGLHLIVRQNGTFGLSDAAKVQFVRPAGDMLFGSAAEVFGHRVIAVVLTGACSDGCEGASAVKRAGGIVIAQNEATSKVFSMPRAIIATGDVDFILPVQEIGPAILSLATTGLYAPAA